jgi:signal transduction histidine kinase
MPISTRQRFKQKLQALLFNANGWVLAASMALGLILGGAGILEPLEAVLYDAMLGASPALLGQAPTVCIAGIDDASLESFPEPLALWHKHLALAITALAKAGAKGIALDIIPSVSLERFTPEADVALMDALRYAQKKNVPVLMGFSLGQQGMAPYFKFRLLASELAYMNLFPDADGRIRKQRPFMKNEAGKAKDSIALAMARLVKAQPLDADASPYYYIDYRLPPPPVVSFKQLIEWGRLDDVSALQKTFANKLVFIGIVSLKPLLDLHRIPIDFSIYAKNQTPGVLIQASMTEGLIQGAVLRPVPAGYVWACLALLSALGAASMLWGTKKQIALVYGAAAVAGLSLCLGLFGMGWLLPPLRLLAALLAPGIAAAAYLLLQREIQRNQLIQQEKMAALTQLVVGVAHEVNTPLGVCVTAASLLKDKTTELTDAFNGGGLKKSELNGFLNLSSETMTLLLSNLQRTAHLVQSFKQTAVDQPCEAKREFMLGQYLRETVSSLQFQFGESACECKIMCSSDILMVSYPSALYEIISQLMDNALKHAFHEDSHRLITLEAEEHGRNVEIRFSDNGQGIAPKEIALIFNPFYTTRRGKGSAGLGLPTVYNWVSYLLRGNIQCHSVLGKGTAFVITLPKAI